MVQRKEVGSSIDVENSETIEKILRAQNKDIGCPREVCIEKNINTLYKRDNQANESAMFLLLLILL